MTESIAAVIAQLDFPPDEQRWLVERLARVKPSERARGMIMLGNEETLRKNVGEDAVTRLQAFQRPFLPKSSFGFAPALHMFYINACCASIWCSTSFAKGMRLDAKAWLLDAPDNAMMMMLRRGLEPNIAELLGFLIDNVGQFFDFGDFWLEKAGKTAVEAHFDKAHAALMGPMIRGATEGILEFLEVEGETSLEVDEEFDEGLLTVRW